MAGVHAIRHHGLHVFGQSIVHRLAPEAKIAALMAFVAAVALTPRRAPLALAGYAVILALALALSRLPWRVVVRIRVVAPFVAFAALLPFVATGERRDVLGVAVSVDGLRAGGAIAAKALLGGFAAIVVTATTPTRSILSGLRRLRVPPIVVGIIGFLFRYLDVLHDQLHRMRMAMTARGHDPRWLWQVRPIASSLGVLFVRSYERGERIHLAMAARGFRVELPDLDEQRAGARDWVAALALTLVCSLILVAAVVST
jgi:cobalt/nickel transport system permease protein